MIWQELPTRRNGPSLWWWKPMNRKLQTKIRYTMGESQNTQIVSRNTFTAASVGSIEKMLAGLFWINQSRTSLVVTVCGQNFQSFGYTADSPENSSQPRHTSPSWPGTSVRIHRYLAPLLTMYTSVYLASMHTVQCHRVTVSLSDCLLTIHHRTHHLTGHCGQCGQYGQYGHPAKHNIVTQPHGDSSYNWVQAAGRPQLVPRYAQPWLEQHTETGLQFIVLFTPMNTFNCV